jgi:hypothetical protein
MVYEKMTGKVEYQSWMSIEELSFVEFVVTPETQWGDIWKRKRLLANTTFEEPGIVLHALRNPVWLVLEHMETASIEVFHIIQKICEEWREIILGENEGNGGRDVNPHFRLILSFNSVPSPLQIRPSQIIVPNFYRSVWNLIWEDFANSKAQKAIEIVMSYFHSSSTPVSLTNLLPDTWDAMLVSLRIHDTVSAHRVIDGALSRMGHESSSLYSKFILKLSETSLHRLQSIAILLLSIEQNVPVIIEGVAATGKTSIIRYFSATLSSLWLYE